jgi:hypothetical protein
MTSIEIRKTDVTGQQILDMLHEVTDEAANASVAHAAATPEEHDSPTCAAADAADEVVRVVRHVYTQYVAFGICPLEKLREFGRKSSSEAACVRLDRLAGSMV